MKRVILCLILGFTLGACAGPLRSVTPHGQSCPTGYPVKGNADSRIFHMPGDLYYYETFPERCFKTPQDAMAAGYRRAKL